MTFFSAVCIPHDKEGIFTHTSCISRKSPWIWMENLSMFPLALNVAKKVLSKFVFLQKSFQMQPFLDLIKLLFSPLSLCKLNEEESTRANI